MAGANILEKVILPSHSPDFSMAQGQAKPSIKA